MTSSTPPIPLSLPQPHQKQRSSTIAPNPQSFGPLPMPPPPDMQSLMDKTANKTVQSQNAFEFEELIRRKQASNPQFAFLFSSHPWNHYYEWKKVTLEQQLQIKQNKINTKNSKDIELKRKQIKNKLIEEINIDELNKILSELNGSNHSINSACKWIIDHKDFAKQVCDELKSYFIKNLMNDSPSNIFDKKLYILFMINDVLHQALKTRISIDKIDSLSHHLSNILFIILPNSYQTYSSQQQQKVMSLLNLWSERSIFNIQLTKKLKDSMIGNGSQPHQWPPHPPHPYPYPTPIVLQHPSPSPFITQTQLHQPLNKLNKLNKNTLHLSIGKIAKLALELRRTGGGGTYVPLPIDKIPINTNNTNNITQNENKFKRAYDQYMKELCLIDNTRKINIKNTSKRSKGRRRRRGYDSRSRSRSRSLSRSRSRSRSLSKSTSRSS